MLSTLLVISILLLLLAIASMLLLLRRSAGGQEEDGRLERVIRDEFERAREAGDKSGRQLREEVASSLGQTSETLVTTMKALGEGQVAQLTQLQSSNEKKLEEMRQTVDEKLQGTLEKRLGESFAQVSKRLEEVHRGLGEMKGLADGVGDLKRVLSNVKARGTWGEVQLRAILEQILTVSQYGKHVKTVPGSDAHVEFAVRLPGPMDGRIEQVWLPIDSKFPQESYVRLQEAIENGDPEAAEQSARELGRSVQDSAKDIREKYVAPPYTTDFAILFLPVESLYAEVLRLPGVIEELQEKHRVIIAGPTTLAAILNSLRMGFHTLAIEQRSSEVWELLSAVKSEFGKFGGVLDKVKRQLETTQRTIEESGVRTRAIERKLRDVETLPGSEADAVLELPELGNGHLDDVE